MNMNDVVRMVATEIASILNPDFTRSGFDRRPYKRAIQALIQMHGPFQVSLWDDNDTAHQVLHIDPTVVACCDNPRCTQSQAFARARESLKKASTMVSVDEVLKLRMPEMATQAAEATVQMLTRTHLIQREAYEGAIDALLFDDRVTEKLEEVSYRALVRYEKEKAYNAWFRRFGRWAHSNLKAFFGTAFTWKRTQYGVEEHLAYSDREFNTRKDWNAAVAKEIKAFGLARRLGFYTGKYASLAFKPAVAAGIIWAIFAIGFAPVALTLVGTLSFAILTWSGILTYRRHYPIKAYPRIALVLTLAVAAYVYAKTLYPVYAFARSATDWHKCYNCFAQSLCLDKTRLAGVRFGYWIGDSRFARSVRRFYARVHRMHPILWVKSQLRRQR